MAFIGTGRLISSIVAIRQRHRAGARADRHIQRGADIEAIRQTDRHIVAPADEAAGEAVVHSDADFAEEDAAGDIRLARSAVTEDAAAVIAGAMDDRADRAVGDGVRSADGMTDQAGTVFSTLDAAFCLHAADGRAADIAEGRDAFRVPFVIVDLDGVAPAVVGAGEGLAAVRRDPRGDVFQIGSLYERVSVVVIDGPRRQRVPVRLGGDVIGAFLVRVQPPGVEVQLLRHAEGHRCLIIIVIAGAVRVRGPAEEAEAVRIEIVGVGVQGIVDDSREGFTCAFYIVCVKMVDDLRLEDLGIWETVLGGTPAVTEARHRLQRVGTDHRRGLQCLDRSGWEGMGGSCIAYCTHVASAIIPVEGIHAASVVIADQGPCGSGALKEDDHAGTETAFQCGAFYHFADEAAGEVVPGGHSTERAAFFYVSAVAADQAADLYSAGDAAVAEAAFYGAMVFAGQTADGLPVAAVKRAALKTNVFHGTKRSDTAEQTYVFVCDTNQIPDDVPVPVEDAVEGDSIRADRRPGLLPGGAGVNVRHQHRMIVVLPRILLDCLRKRQQLLVIVDQECSVVAQIAAALGLDIAADSLRFDLAVADSRRRQRARGQQTQQQHQRERIGRQPFHRFLHIVSLLRAEVDTYTR